MSRFEDPEKVMDQALIDMKNDIVRIRRTYAEVTAGQRRLVSQKKSTGGRCR
jgi:phage shock protein A